VGATGGGGVGPHHLAWIRQHAPTQSAVYIRDMSGQYTTVGLWGPRARDILQPLVAEDISNAAFPFYTAQPLQIECVPALALRLSYAGELGWEIYAPCEYGLRLWDLLWEIGRPHGLVAAGGGAFALDRLGDGNSGGSGVDRAPSAHRPSADGREVSESVGELAAATAGCVHVCLPAP